MASAGFPRIDQPASSSQTKVEECVRLFEDYEPMFTDPDNRTRTIYRGPSMVLLDLNHRIYLMSQLFPALDRHCEGVVVDMMDPKLVERLKIMSEHGVGHQTIFFKPAMLYIIVFRFITAESLYEIEKDEKLDLHNLYKGPGPRHSVPEGFFSFLDDENI